MILHTRIPALFGAVGMSLAPGVILLHPLRRGDRSLIAHEQEHGRQQRATGLIRWWWRYLTIPAFRLEQELVAYRVQVANGGSFEGAALNLSAHYRLNITYEQALEALQCR